MTKTAKKWWSLTKQIPLYWVIIIALILALPVNIYINHFNVPVAHNNEGPEDCFLPYELLRQNDSKLTSQIMLVNVGIEDEKLMPLKEKVNQYLEEQKAGGTIKTASVYFKILNDDHGWFVINPEEKYYLASLLKVSFMIAMLKEAENNPGVLDKKVYYAKHSAALNPQAMLDHQLQPGRYYTIRELLKYAISYSDNDAAYLVVDNFNLGTLQKLHSDLNLGGVDFHKEYFGTVEEYSRFLRILYNGSYINNDMSEYALELMTQSDFNDGIVKKIDKNVLVARKFGERGLADKELHEFGIVYLEGQPYLIGIMTRGKDYDELKEIISEISLMVFKEMKKSV